MSEETDPPWPELELLSAPSPEHRVAILQALVEYNQSSGPGSRSQPLAIVVRDQGGAVSGGLWAHSLYDWLVVELLVVPESLRGQGLGSRLLASAEEEARKRGCVGVWLDTFSFQARGFYERNGYSVCGTIPDHPVGGSRYFLSKRLA